MTKPLCIYHGNCADGFTAAWAVWKFFQGIDGCDFHAGVYQDAPPDVTNRDVILVDFSYKRGVLQEMRRKANSILVLDHHKSAAEDLDSGDGFVDMRGWSSPNNWDRHLLNVKQDEYEGAHNVIYTLLDMERSGAGLAWDYFHGSKRPALVNYVEDRDLWRFKLDRSRDINANIFSHSYDFGEWNEMAGWIEREPERFADAGEAIERKHHKDVAELVRALRQELVIAGQWVPVANLPYTLTSDAGHLMCQPYASPNLSGEIVTPPFAACYWDTPDGRVFSLRSIEGGADVSVVAGRYGGGGHKHAAGFRLPHGQQP